MNDIKIQYKTTRVIIYFTVSIHFYFYFVFFSLKTEAEIVACIQIQNSALLFQVSLFVHWFKPRGAEGGGDGDVWEISPGIFRGRSLLGK